MKLCRYILIPFIIALVVSVPTSTGTAASGTNSPTDPRGGTLRIAPPPPPPPPVDARTPVHYLFDFGDPDHTDDIVLSMNRDGTLVERRGSEASGSRRYVCLGELARREILRERRGVVEKLGPDTSGRSTLGTSYQELDLYARDSKKPHYVHDYFEHRGNSDTPARERAPRIVRHLMRRLDTVWERHEPDSRPLGDSDRIGTKC